MWWLWAFVWQQQQKLNNSKNTQLRYRTSFS
jgi:hypothetical protein